MENTEIARVLLDVRTLLEIQGANPFRVRAYENAARTVETHAVPMRTLVADGAKLTDLPGIGKEMAAHIHELVTTGRLSLFAELSAEVPASLIQLVRLPGVGPKRAMRFWKELGIETVDQLEAAAGAEAIRVLDGFGQKTEERILKGIVSLRRRGNRFKLSDADQMVQPLLAYLREHPAVSRVEVTGSYRRRLETVGDIDLLAIADDASSVMAHFAAYERIAKVEMAGETRGTVGLQSGLQVDLRVLPEESYGAALQYFTGSKAHNVKLRTRAVRRGLRVSEYGVFRVPEGAPVEEDDPRAGDRVAGRTEADVYAALELPYIEPELREDRGEIEAALRGDLPTLLAERDLKGDLQMHSTWSDGENTVAEMAAAARARGYEYIAITDHTRTLAMTGGLDASAARDQWEEIAEVARDLAGIEILRSMEVDVLRDGSLGIEDEVIEQLDLVLVSIHSLFELPAAEQTRRIVRAVEHPGVHVLGHPTGRLINRRDPYAFDLEDVMHCAKERGVALELNAHPNRLDLKDTQLMLARDLGIPIVISTDAHRTRDLDLMRYGVEQARRAWLTRDHVLNARPLADLRAWLHGARSS